MDKSLFIYVDFNNFILTTGLDPPLTLFMRATKSILEFNPSGEDRADIEEGDKIDSNEFRGAVRKEKAKDKDITEKEPKKYIKIAVILNKVFDEIK